METEKKYLVTSDIWRKQVQGTPKAIKQSYLADSHNSDIAVRIIDRDQSTRRLEFKRGDDVVEAPIPDNVWSELEAESKERLFEDDGTVVIDSDLSLRIRTIDGSAGRITIKASTGHAISRHELEFDIDMDKALHLQDNFATTHLYKDRHIIPFTDGSNREWEVDVFKGANEGLIVAEVELDSADETFALPSWVGDEVTTDSRYSNRGLSKNPFTQWPAGQNPESFMLLHYLRGAIDMGEFPGIATIEELADKLGSVHVVRHGETQANVEKRINPAPKHLPTSDYMCAIETEYPYDDRGETGLTGEGIKQAKDAAGQLDKLADKPTKLFVSPQERGYETARIIGQALGFKQMHIHPDLREREFGPYAGIPIKEVDGLCKQRNATLKAKQLSSNTAERMVYSRFQADEMIGEMNDAGGVTAHWFNQHPHSPTENAGESWPQCQRRAVKTLTAILSDSFKSGDTPALITHGDMTRMISASLDGVGWYHALANPADHIKTIANGRVYSFDVGNAIHDLLEKEKAAKLTDRTASPDQSHQQGRS